MLFFLFNRTTLQVFVTYLTGALYVHPLWFYKHQHNNRATETITADMLQTVWNELDYFVFVVNDLSSTSIKYPFKMITIVWELKVIIK